jgi:hypothetical protein
LLAACLLAGCARDAMPPVPEQQDGVARVAWLEQPPYRIDLLFVIDDSPAMAAFSSSLAEAVRLSAYELAGTGEPLDARIAVITADVGDEDATPHAGECAGWGDAAALRRSSLVDGSYLAYRSAGEVRTNVAGSVGDALGDLAAVGTGGCAHPRPLEAMRIALVREARAGGFLRDNAKLSVVFIGALDDESPGSLADYEAFLEGLGHDVAVIVSGGTPFSHGCGEASTDRLFAFQRLFPNRGTFFSNCGLATGGIMQMALFYHLPAFGPRHVNPCFDEPLADLDPEAPGIQPECSVSEHVGWGTADEQDWLLPPCGRDMLPCWRIVEDNQCGTVQQLRVDIDRGDEDPPDNDLVEAQCVSS